MEPAHIITLAILFISSIKDLRTRRGLKDKHYILAILLISGSFITTSGPGTVGASLFQAMIGLIAGILLRLFIKFGGADAWTISLITANFPETIIFRPLAYTLIPLVIYLKIYKLTGRNKAPAIPALTAGFILSIIII
jgi:hypothetical protein